MNRRERVHTALSKEKPDRPPLQISFTKEFGERLSAHYGVYDNHTPMAGNSISLEELSYQDMLLHAVGWVNGYFSSEEPHFTDEWGVAYERIPYTTKFGTGSYAEVMSHPLQQDSDISSYRSPDPTRPELYHKAFQLLDLYKDDWFMVGCAVTTIFETGCALRGMEQLLMDFLLDSDLAESILDIPYQYHAEVAKQLTRMGYDMIRLGDDVGGQEHMIMSPETWRKHLKPRMASLISDLKHINPNVYVGYHSDGNIEPIIPDLIEIGLDVLNPIQPKCMNAAEIKKKYGENLTLWGTIDEQETLPFKTPKDVWHEVKDRIEFCGYNGGLILGPTHHVQLDTPIENFEAMIHSAIE